MYGVANLGILLLFHVKVQESSDTQVLLLELRIQLRKTNLNIFRTAPVWKPDNERT